MSESQAQKAWLISHKRSTYTHSSIFTRTKRHIYRNFYRLFRRPLIFNGRFTDKIIEVIKRLKHILILVAVILHCSFLTDAQNNASVWTLEDCIYRAQSQSMDYKQAVLTTRSAEINKTQAQYSRYPSLNLDGSYGYNFGRTIDPTSNEFIASNLGFNSLGASINMPVFAGNRINSSIQQTQLDYASASANQENVKRQIILSVANTYLSILMAEEQVKNAEKQLDLSTKQLRRIDELIETGAEARNARLDFVAQESMSEENLIVAMNNLASTKLELMQALLLDMDIDEFNVSVPELEPEAWAEETIPSLTELLPRALHVDPRIKSDSLALRADEYGIKVARGSLYPMLSLSGSLSTNYSTQGLMLSGFETVTNRVEFDLNGQPIVAEIPTEVPIYDQPGYFEQLQSNFGYGFVVGLSVPIFNNYQNKASVEQAKVNYLHSETQLERTHWQIKSEVQQVILNAKAAQRSYIAQLRSTDALKDAYENAVTRHELGMINNYDLLQAQNEYDQANQSLTSAKYDLIFKLKVIDYYKGELITIE